jgi:hypothetical protein
MATYRYLFADLLTNTIIGELPLTNVNFTQQLNASGTFTGTLLLSGVDAETYNVDASTIPARTAVYVDRDGTLIWGGILWGRDYDSKSQTLKLQAREFESYFERRRITTTTVFNAVDQLTAVQNLITNAQAALGGNIGVQLGGETSGVTITRTFYGYERKTVYSAIQDLSKALDGFDFRIYVYYDSNGNPAKLLKLGYPRLGEVYTPTSLTIPVFQLPGNIVEYTYPEDGSIAANTVYALGAGSNEGKLISTAVDGEKLAEGWPLLEEAPNYSDISNSTLLLQLAQGQVAVVSYPPTTIKLSQTPTMDPILGSYEIGDDARFIALDDRFPNGIDSIYRVIALNVTAGENNNPELVTATLAFVTSSTTSSESSSIAISSF